MSAFSNRRAAKYLDKLLPVIAFPGPAESQCFPFQQIGSSLLRRRPVPVWIALGNAVDCPVFVQGIADERLVKRERVGLGRDRGGGQTQECESERDNFQNCPSIYARVIGGIDEHVRKWTSEAMIY